MSDSMRPRANGRGATRTPQLRMADMVARSAAVAAKVKDLQEVKELRHDGTRGLADMVRRDLAPLDGLPAGEGMVVRARVFHPAAGSHGVWVGREARRGYAGMAPVTLAEVFARSSDDGRTVWLELDGDRTTLDVVLDLVVARVEAAFTPELSLPGDPDEEIPF